MKLKILAVAITYIIFSSTLIASANIVTKHETDTISWDLITDGFGNKHNFATRGISIYKDELYFGTHNHNNSKKITIKEGIEYLKSCFKMFHGNIFNKFWTVLTNLGTFHYALKSDGCEIWKYNATTKELHQVVGNLPEADIKSGFGDPTNEVAGIIIEFKGKLYVGAKGVWRYDGRSWEQVAPNGFGDLSNDGPWCAKVFKDHIYIGTSNWDESPEGFCQVWRSSDGKNWTKVVDRGFRDFDTTERTNNRYAWSMEVYKDHLYVGTYNHPGLLGHKGCQLYSTSDGENWSKVILPGGDGFGEPLNLGIRNMAVYNGWLYIGTGSLGYLQGLEIWKYNGDIWIPVIGDDVPGIKSKPRHIRNDGFGTKNNCYAFSMIVSSDNKLWVGTANNIDGCELYRYDGTSWKQIVGDKQDSEVANGFGSLGNVGARSMIEYPSGSRNIVIGTWANEFCITSNTCQVWVRNVK